MPTWVYYPQPPSNASELCPECGRKLRESHRCDAELFMIEGSFVVESNDKDEKEDEENE